MKGTLLFILAGLAIMLMAYIAYMIGGTGQAIFGYGMGMFVTATLLHIANN